MDYEPFDCKDDHEFANKMCADLTRIELAVKQIREDIDIYLKKVTQINKEEK